MKKIVISINPIYVQSIINGTKKFEYRTKVGKKDIHSLVIYETFPVKKVVAEAEVLGVIASTPNELWNLTHEFGGISKADYDAYFKDRKVAYAYKLGKIKVYDIPLDIKLFGLKTAPQSFAAYGAIAYGSIST